jgi:hypothetical protein
MISDGSMAIIIAVMLIYGMIMVKQFRIEKDKGELLIASKRVINSNHILMSTYIILLCLYTGRRIQYHMKWDETDIVFTTLLGLAIIFSVYQSLRKQALYEKILVTPERTYLLESIIDYEWGSFIETEESIVLRLKVKVSFLSRIKIKEVYIKAKAEEKEKIEVFLSTNIIKNEL